MKTDSEDSPSVEDLLSLVRHALVGARDSSHVCGLVRGLEIGVSTLCDPKNQTQEIAGLMRRRFAILSKSDDSYHSGAAAGILLSIQLAIALESRIPEPLRLAPSEAR
jgi:hypothetical protein